MKINIYGFDTGEGMPASDDKRDLIFYYAKGQYKVDKEKLSSIIHSKIYYGDLKSTVSEFIDSNPKKYSMYYFRLRLLFFNKKFS